MQKRIVRKRELEKMLSQIEPHPFPKPGLEQYTVPADVAATMLYIAAYTYGDIIAKTVLDLGCGTGRLALGAALLGARRVVGIDIDKDAVKMASENSLRMYLKEKTQWISGDINAICGEFDTVLQNPPFGIQRRNADRKFLEKALATGKAVYSFHKSPTKGNTFVKTLKANKANAVPVSPSPFLKEFIERHGGKIRGVYAVVMTVQHMFSFHTKKRHEFVADLYVIEKR